MTTMEVASRLVELCRQGKNGQAIESLYSPDIVSVEAAASTPQMPAETKGLQNVLGKHKWWEENHTVHSAKVEGPYPHGDRFIVRYDFDITRKQTGERVRMDEAALYAVKNGKIVREEFFYQTA